MNASLVMVKSDGTEKIFPMAKDRLVIGRTNHCDLRIPISSVSRQHCEILIRDGKVQVRDLGSSNGTFHNDKRIQESTLAQGDKLTVGQVTFRVLIDLKAPNPPSAAAAKSVPQVSNVAAKQETSKGQKMPAPAQEDDEEVLALVEEESQSPTTDLDDPFAALEALAKANEAKEQSTKKPGTDAGGKKK